MSEMNSPRSGFPRRIGEFAADLGINPKTIRYYEEIGLLPPPMRSPSGYRQYSAVDAERLRFITKAKAIGLTLREIREILALRDGGEEPCPHLGQLLDRKLAAVDVHLRLLTEMRAELLALQAEMAVTACSSTAICGPIERHQPAPVR
jgi:MerR family transcriptional regulator, Zn(II)-responsive regulator of zntA